MKNILCLLVLSFISLGAFNEDARAEGDILAACKLTAINVNFNSNKCSSTPCPST